MTVLAKPWAEKTFDQKVATVLNEAKPRWWNSLSDHTRRYLLGNPGGLARAAFEAGVRAGMQIANMTEYP